MDKDDRPELLTIWDEARGHMEKSDYDKAIETYQKVLDLEPDNARAKDGMEKISNK